MTKEALKGKKQRQTYDFLLNKLFFLVFQFYLVKKKHFCRKLHGHLPTSILSTTQDAQFSMDFSYFLRQVHFSFMCLSVRPLIVVEIELVSGEVLGAFQRLVSKNND